MTRSIALLAGLGLLTVPALAHDTWVQTNTNVIRPGDAVHIDLMLGNHGNDHRDFKLASKLSPDMIGTFEVVAPDGKRYDLTDRLADLGYAPKEGFWSAKFVPAAPGLYAAAQTADQVVRHGKPVRAYRSAKAFFVVSPSLDNVPRDNPGFDRPLGHPIELVPESNPVTPMGPGTPIRVRVLLRGAPLAGARVSFIPRGETLGEGLDRRYERITDAQGRASFTPAEGNYYLVAVHHAAPEEKGEGFDGAHYSATLTVLVPEKCPCCGE
ncbi:MAG TPA: DUF4198 domain-containing protein [Gemmataceae bacterium]